MLRPFYLITIQQLTPYISEGVAVTRDKTLILDFVTSYEVESGWENHTDTAKITFPKNVILRSKEMLFKQTGTYNVILGGTGEHFDSEGNKIIISPLIMRGDFVTIQSGYFYKNESGQDVEVGSTVFTGFVSKVFSQIPIEIECEDNFFLLKRTPLDVSVWNKELVSLCDYILQKVNEKYHYTNPIYPLLEMSKLTDSLTANFALGHLDIGQISCAECLNKIRSQYKLESFFVENELRFGFPIYDDSKESKNNSDNFFEFENNIIEDDLEYINKGDIILSAIVNCVVVEKTGRHTHDNVDVTKRAKHSVLIYYDLSSESFKYHKKDKGLPFPTNEGGERREFIYAISPNKRPPSDEELFEYGKLQLEKYYYTGFRGHFKTFGFPFVKWGDNVNIKSRVMADRNGVYKVKKVTYYGGVEGLKQEICLDYKLNIPFPSSTRQIVMR